MKHGGNFMSNKVMEFYSKAVNDEQFVKSLEKFKTENGTEKTEAIKKVVLPYAKKLGYSFTEDELLHNLTEEELSQIAGGWLGSSLAAAATALAGLVGFGGGEAPPAQQPSQSTVRQQSEAPPPAQQSSQSTVRQQEDNNTEQSIVARSEFTDNADGTCTLKRMNDRNISGAVTIPSEVNGKPITNIGEFAFQECAGITTLAIPASVQVIGTAAFQQCFGVTTIVFESGSRLHTIGSSAFAGTRVKSLNIPNGVTEINGSTFFACSDLEEIYIPKTVTSIKSNAFSGCKNLKRVHIPAHAKISKTILFPAEYLDLPEGCTVEYY